MQVCQERHDGEAEEGKEQARVHVHPHDSAEGLATQLGLFVAILCAIAGRHRNHR